MFPDYSSHDRVVNCCFCEVVVIGTRNLMVLQSDSSASPLNSCDFSQKSLVLPSISQSHRKRQKRIVLIKNARWVLLQDQACINGGNAQHHHLGEATRRGANNIILKRFYDGRDLDYAYLSRFYGSSNYYSSTFEQDPIVDKLRSQLGVIHAIPSPTQINSSIFGIFAFFFLWELVLISCGPQERGILAASQRIGRRTSKTCCLAP